MDALAIPRAVLAGYDWGGRAACVVAALYPERVRGLVSCGTGYNIQDSSTVTKPVSPGKEHRYWYWYYLNSERGRTAPIERRLAGKPKITVPTIVLEGKDDGVDPPALDSDVRPHFTQLRDLKAIAGVGHNLPQEAPDTFAEAVLAL